MAYEIISVEEDTDGQGPIVDFDPGNEEYWEYVFKDWNPNTTRAEAFDLQARFEEVEKERRELQRKEEKSSN